MPPLHDTPTLSVSQLTQAIKIQLESTFPAVRIQGEISNFRHQCSGHLYFSLKDSQAQVSSVMFRGDAARLHRRPQDGDQVVVEGEINVYPPRGNYQLIVRHLEFAGVGALLLKLEQLKEELRRRGWLDAERKKPLPNFPKRIGVITSPTGAAIQDILNVLTRRFHGLHILIYPVRVQGQGAGLEIAKAIQECNRLAVADVLIVGRGGGSIEDLWAFNEEAVAKAIFESQIPIVSAVGHETDFSLSDLVADVRAPTPSAAAELVVAEKEQCVEHLRSMAIRLQHCMHNRLHHARERLRQVCKHPLLASPYALLGIRMQRLDELKSQIDQAMDHNLRRHRVLLRGLEQQCSALSPTRQVSRTRQQLLQYHHRLEEIWHHQHHLRKVHLKSVVDHLHAIDPHELLKKGYSILFSQKTGSVVKSLETLSHTTQLRIRVSDGEVLANLKDLEIL